jgi:hypothetical protein
MQTCAEAASNATALVRTWAANEGGHWLGTFAMYLVTERGRPR